MLSIITLQFWQVCPKLAFLEKRQLWCLNLLKEFIAGLQGQAVCVWNALDIFRGSHNHTGTSSHSIQRLKIELLLSEGDFLSILPVLSTYLKHILDRIKSLRVPPVRGLLLKSNLSSDKQAFCLPQSLLSCILAPAAPKSKGHDLSGQQMFG